MMSQRTKRARVAVAEARLGSPEPAGRGRMSEWRADCSLAMGEWLPIAHHLGPALLKED